MKSKQRKVNKSEASKYKNVKYFEFYNVCVILIGQETFLYCKLKSFSWISCNKFKHNS